MSVQQMGYYSLSGTKYRIRQAFDQAALTYDDAADVQREISDILAVYLTQCKINSFPDTILDAGCGTGYGAVWLQKSWPQAHLILVDFAPSMLATARDRCHTGVDLVCADIEALPTIRGSCDLYWSSLAWQWNSPHRCLLEADRVLRSSGIIAVATLGIDNFSELRSAFSEVDNYSHVMNIQSHELLLAGCRERGWQVKIYERHPIRRYYPDVRSLLKTVKKIGASEVEKRRPALFSRAAWYAMIDQYEKWREPNGLPLTYDVIWLIATR